MCMTPPMSEVFKNKLPYKAPAKTNKSDGPTPPMRERWHKIRNKGEEQTRKNHNPTPTPTPNPNPNPYLGSEAHLFANLGTYTNRVK